MGAVTSNSQTAEVSNFSPYGLNAINSQDTGIVSVATQNQITIRVFKPDSNTFKRILVEKPEINLGEDLKLSGKEIEDLTKMDSSKLSSWAAEHGFMVTKADYVAGTIFRTHPYETFMCDLDEENRTRVESEMDKVTVFSDEEKFQFTKGRWWEAIDKEISQEGTSEESQRAYEAICYRTLRSLKEGKLDLDDVSKILNYCGARIQFPDVEVLTGDEFEEAIIPDLLQIFSDLGRWVHFEDNNFSRDEITPFLRDLPDKDRVCFRSQNMPRNYPIKVLMVPSMLNQLTRDLFGSEAMLSRPAAGMSHRNRFASALDRISATFIPGVEHPKEIHGIECKGWMQDSIHDVVHQLIESRLRTREVWIAFAKYVHRQTGNEELYNAMLDRSIPNNFEKGIMRLIELLGVFSPDKILLPTTVYKLAKQFYSQYDKRAFFDMERIRREGTHQTSEEVNTRVKELIDSTEDLLNREEQIIAEIQKLTGEEFMQLEKNNYPLFAKLVQNGKRVITLLEQKVTLADIISINPDSSPDAQFNEPTVIDGENISP